MSEIRMVSLYFPRRLRPWPLCVWVAPVLALSAAAAPVSPGRTGKVSSGQSVQVTDARTLAAAKALVTRAVAVPPASLRVALSRRPGRNLIDGQASDTSGTKVASFGITAVDGKQVLSYLNVAWQPSAPRPPLGLTKGATIGERLAAALYPRWKGHRMTLVNRNRTHHGPRARGQAMPRPAYEFGWVETVRPGYYSRNSVSLLLDAATGKLGTYHASFAFLPLKYPIVSRERAQTAANAWIHGRNRNTTLAAPRVVRHNCTLGGGGEPPVWYFEYRWTIPAPLGKEALHAGDSARVDGVTGTVIAPGHP